MALATTENLFFRKENECILYEKFEILWKIKNCFKRIFREATATSSCFLHASNLIRIIDQLASQKHSSHLLAHLTPPISFPNFLPHSSSFLNPHLYVIPIHSFPYFLFFNQYYTQKLGYLGSDSFLKISKSNKALLKK